MTVKYLIYLLNDCGSDTGETFRTWDEVHQWYYDVVGEWPKSKVKAAMRSGQHFGVGARSFTCEKRKSDSLTAVA